MLDDEREGDWKELSCDTREVSGKIRPSSQQCCFPGVISFFALISAWMNQFQASGALSGLWIYR